MLGGGGERRGVSGRREQKEVRVGGERGGRSEQMVTCWSSQSLDSRLTNGSKSRTLEHIHNNIHDTIHYDAKEHFAFYSTDIFHDLPQTLREADSSAMFCRHPKTHQFFFIDFSFSVSAGLTMHCNFSISCQDPLYLLVLVFLWEKKISFSALSIQVNGTVCYRNGHHHLCMYCCIRSCL